MATERNIVGFEMLGFGEAKWAGTSVNVGMTVQSGGTRSGSGPGRFQLATQNSATNLVIFPARAIVGTSGTVTAGNHKRCRSRIYFRIESVTYPFGNSFIRIYGHGGEFATNQIGIWMDAQNQLTVSVGAGTPANSGSGWSGSHTSPLTTGVWYQIILDVDIAVSAGTSVYTAVMTVLADGSSAVPQTVTATGNQGANVDELLQLCFCSDRIRGAFDCSATLSYDDWVYMAASNADATSALTLPTATHIFAIVPPTGLISSGWTGTYTDVDDYPVNNTDQMSSSGPSGTEFELSHGSGIALGIGTASAIKLYVNALDSGGGGNCDFMLAGTATTVLLGANYADSNGTHDPVGGLIWTPSAPYSSLAIGAVTMGARKQNGTHATAVGNIGLEILGELASYSSGNQIRGSSQIKPGSIYDGQVADAANIARHKISGLSDGPTPIFIPAEDNPPEEWMIPPGAPGSLAPPAKPFGPSSPPVFFPDSDQIEEMPMGGGGGGGTQGAQGPAGPTGAAGFAGLVLLNETVASSSATLDIATRNTSGLSGTIIQSDFDEYVVEFVDLVVATSAADLLFRVSTDGGSTFDSGNNYQWARFLMQAAASSSGGSAADSSIKLAVSLNNTASKAVSGSFKIAGALQSTVQMNLRGQSCFYASDASWNNYSLAGTYLSLSSVNAFRLLASSGNINSGTVRVYGVMKSVNPVANQITGALVFLKELVASSSAQLDFTSFVTSDFEEYVFELLGIVPATDNTDLWMRCSTDNGSTFDTGSNYKYASYLTNDSGSFSTNTVGSNSATKIVLAANVDNSSAAGWNGAAKLMNPSSTSLHKTVNGDFNYLNNDTNRYRGMMTGFYVSTTAVNAIRFLFSSGNIASGTIRVYGVLKSGAVPPAAVLKGTYSARPAALVNGRLYWATDGFTIARDNGTSWDVWGPTSPLTEPSDSGFSWVNQGSSTITTDRGRLLLHGAGTGAAVNFAMRVKSAPATPYTITFRVIPPPLCKLYHGYGIMARQSAAGTGQNRFVALWWCAGNAAGTDVGGIVRCEKWTNPTTFSASYEEYRAAKPVEWFRVTDDGTNLIFYVSNDGDDWIQIDSHLRADFMLQNPDQYGFGVFTMNNVTPNLDVPLTVVSIKQT